MKQKIVTFLITILFIAGVVFAYFIFQQNAKNAPRIEGAVRARNLIKSHFDNFHSYPADSDSCITTDNICSTRDGTPSETDNTHLMTALRRVGTEVKSVSRQPGNYYGIWYHYRADMTYNGQKRQVLLMYWLEGENQQCGMTDVAVQAPPDLPEYPDPWVSSKTGYSSSSDGRTNCYVAI